MTQTTAQEIEAIKLRAEISKDVFVMLLKNVHAYDKNGVDNAAQLAINAADILIEKLNGQ